MASSWNLRCLAERRGALRTSATGREYLHRDDDGWQQIHKRDADPHQGAGRLLVSKCCRVGKWGCTAIVRVHDVITEREVSREHITGQRGEEKVHGDGPARPSRLLPRLDHRPPEEKSSSEEACELDKMPPMGAHP